MQAASDAGFFYVVQPMPAVPEHVKLGFASDVQERFGTYRILCPDARLIKAWPCLRSEEQKALKFARHPTCQLYKGEVFHCSNIPLLVRRFNRFFTHDESIPEGFVPLSEVIRTLRVGHTTIRQLMESGQIHGQKFNGEYHIASASFTRYLKEIGA